ncbi:MAG: S8 family serine peptidase [Synergistaceae bacterium]|nr:S8 family serine peptidase [Synergistaceae bacterium]
MMRKILSAVLFLLLMISSSSALEYTDGDVIVVLKSSTEEGRVTASDFAGQFKASVKEFYSSLSETGGDAFMMMHSDEFDAEELSSILRENPNVLAASPNYKVHAAMIPNDSGFSECWGMNEINASSAWNVTTGNSNVYVAVIDSGIDHTNPDLTANVDTAHAFRSVAGDANDGKDDYGHGTHVAGTIGAVGNNSIGIVGVNWNVKMIPVKALDSSGSGTIATVISAMNYVTSLIKNGLNIRAVNLSLETYMNIAPNHDNLIRMPLWRAFKVLDDTNKAVIVVAAGNQSETVGQPSSYAHGTMIPGAGYYAYPASFKGLDNLISVSALGRNDDGTIVTAAFSNKGADIGAPGVNILSTWLQSSTANIRSDGVSLRTSQGTSMAAPHVSGTAALIASRFPTATAYQIRQSILIGSQLDANASLSYAASRMSTLSARGTEGRSYDDYNPSGTDYDYGTDSGKSSSSSGGGCNGISFGFACIAVLISLARKRMN